LGRWVSQDDVSLNDMASCLKLCDCNADCTVPGDVCVDDTQGRVERTYGRKGYCRWLVDGDAPLVDCASGGAGGGAGTGG